MNTIMLPVDEVRSDGGTQTRAELRSDVIEEYAEAMRSGAEFPPVDIFLDKNNHYWLADGFHRYSAAAVAEQEKIKANVHKGELRDAVWFALSANTTNGIRLTNADKRRRVEMALADGEWKAMSDNAIAEHVGVSVPFVGSVRGQLLTVNNSPDKPVRRKGKDGKSYPASKKRKPAPMPKPTASPGSTEPDECDDAEPRVEFSVADEVVSLLAKFDRIIKGATPEDQERAADAVERYVGKIRERIGAEVAA